MYFSLKCLCILPPVDTMVWEHTVKEILDNINLLYKLFWFSVDVIESCGKVWCP